MSKHKLSEPTKYEMPMPMNDELKMLREDIDSLTKTLNSMSKLVLAHDDTLTRLCLEMLEITVEKGNEDE
jgi:hypothetical protein